MPKPNKPKKSKSSKKKESTPVPAPVVEPTPPPTPVKVQVKKVPTSELTDSIFNDIQAELVKMSEIGVQMPGLKKHLVSLKKSLDKERKESTKGKKVRKASTGIRAPSGFAKPSVISQELAKFLGKDKKDLVARTEVTRFITGYIRDKDLQDPANRRTIKPDASLKKLLGVSAEDPPVTYFNLQKFLSKHYPKKVVVA
jgi:chromatin remodeling complex protein RSC6